jgi:hypothetical protein
MRALIAVMLFLLYAPRTPAADTLQTASAVPDSAMILRRIMITGNNQTKDVVITREMELQPGQHITPEALAYDRGRIYSLGLFNDVRLHVVPADSGSGMADVVVEVVHSIEARPRHQLGRDLE